MESDLSKRIEALRLEAEEQTRKGQLDRAAEIQFGELPRLEAELKRLTGEQDGTANGQGKHRGADSRADDGPVYQYAHRGAQGYRFRYGHAHLGWDLRGQLP